MASGSPQFHPFPRLLAWGFWLIAIAFLAGLVGPIFRDNDQASILMGAWEIAHGEAAPWRAPFYHYDKQFLTYGFLALSLVLIPGNAVAVANLAVFAAFWASLAGLLARKPPRTTGQLAGFVACIWAPVIWQHAAFFSGNLLAAALIFTAFAIWSPANRGRKIFAVILLGLAVGARADALLALPFCAWLGLSRRSVRRLLTSAWAWAIGLSGAAVLILGRLTFTGQAMDWAPFFFDSRVFAAYWIFGFGAAGLVLFWLAAQLLRLAIRRSSRYRLFYLAGFIALLLPVLYYSLQFFSTLYFVAELAILILFVLSRRGRVLLTGGIRMRWMPAFIAAVTLIPLVVGLNLNLLKRPQLTWGPGTIFPTADGHLTMGGYWHALLRQIRAGGIRDHNQALWLAAQSVDYQTAPDGRVPILDTPMSAYLKLAATLQGKPFRLVPSSSPWFYMDSRHLVRRVPAFGGSKEADWRDRFQNRNIEWASPIINDYGIVRLSAGRPNAEFQRMARLSRIFEGNEFREIPPGDSFAPARWEGKTLVFLADRPFAIEFRPKNQKPRILASKPLEGMHGLKITGAERTDDTLGPGTDFSEGGVSVYVSNLVDYMSAKNLADSSETASDP